MIPNESKIKDEGKHFALLVAVIVAAISLLPMLIGTVTSTVNNAFVGYPNATDDHMVYAAWMKQAQDFRFFFDNRFAVDAQPGLTVHLYFFVLGLLSKIVGIPWASALAKAFFAGFFVILCQRLLRKFTEDLYTIKLTLGLVVLGGGIGTLVWHKFGEAITIEVNEQLTNALQGRLPTDVWQPEGFVFPSMLTNSLFMVSMCLMIGIILALLESKDSWKPVLCGAGCVFVLTNIHSYDVLLMLLVSVGFIAISSSRKRMSGAWLLRGAAIFAGGIPSGLWIYWVLQKDPVFQARAATLTYSPNFRQVFFGYLILMVFAIIGFFFVNQKADDRFPMRRALGGIGVIAIIATLYLMAPNHRDGYFMTPTMFAGVFIAMIVCGCLLAGDNDLFNFVLAWALVGLVAMYFPALFQRKLAIGLSIPWAILAGMTLSSLLKDRRGAWRTLASALVVCVAGVSSVRWLERELWLIKDRVSRTTTHPLFLSRTMQDIVIALNDRSSEKRTVIAVPGAANSRYDGEDPKDIDEFDPPILADLNPIVSGLTGAYSYAGHWSETPDYLVRRKNALKFFMTNARQEFRQSIIDEIDPNSSVYAIGPTYGTFGQQGKSGFADPERLGEVIVKGNDYVLVKIR